MPEIPADLSSLSGSELTELLYQVQAFFEENRDEGDLGELAAAADAVDAIRGEEESRASTRAALDARVNPPDETDGVAPGEGGALEPVAASSRRTPARPRAPRSMQPRESSSGHGTVVTAAGLELRGGIRAIAEEIIEVDRRQRGSQRGPEQSVAATIRRPSVDNERYLSGLDGAEANLEKVRAATTPEAITAAGGLCAPTAGYYDQLVIAGADRPVRDALVTFGADRGGIRFIPPPTLSDVASGVTRVTAAQDASGATKPCVTITCPATTEVQVAAVPYCLQVGNFRGRSNSEQVAAWLELLLATQARVAETALLDGISTCSTAVTAAQQYGTARQVVAQVARAAAAFRSRQRMRPDARLHFMAPAWLGDAMVADLVNSGGVGDAAFYGGARGQITTALAQVNVNATWYVDTKTGAGQVFGAQGVGGLLPWPTTAVWYLFAEGSFIFLDGGTLDLGTVRDSTLNANNNFQMFAESFENVACVGPQSLEVTATVCADGTYAPAGTDIGCP